MNAPDSDFQAVALTVEIALRLSEIPRNSVPDLPDWMIAATAPSLGLPLLIRDERIRALFIETIR